MSEEVKNDVVTENEKLKTEATPDPKEVSLIADIRSKIGYSGMINIAIGLILLMISIPWGIGWLTGYTLIKSYPFWKEKRILMTIGIILFFIFPIIGLIWMLVIFGIISYPKWQKKNTEEKAARDKAFAEELAKQMAKEMNKDK